MPSSSSFAFWDLLPSKHLGLTTDPGVPQAALQPSLENPRLFCSAHTYAKVAFLLASHQVGRRASINSTADNALYLYHILHPLQADDSHFYLDLCLLMGKTK